MAESKNPMSVNEANLGSDSTPLIKGCLSDEELEKTASLLRVVWPHGDFIRPEYLHWLYCENPVGSAEVCNVWDCGRIVAHYAAIPIVAELFGGREKGLLSLNTAVHPSYRGKGYFKTLATQVFEDARARGAGFVIGVANGNSSVLFRRQLLFQIVCPLSVKIGLGVVKQSFSSREQRLDFAHSWDEQTLTWRLQRPGATYCVRNNKGSITVRGYTGKFGMWATMGNMRSIQTRIPNRICFRWNPLSLWIGLDDSCDWRRSMYLNLPDRLKPSPLNLVFKDLSGQGRTLVPQKVLFSLLDFDAY